MIFKSVILGFGEVVSFLVIIYLSKYFEYISRLVYYMDIAWKNIILLNIKEFWVFIYTTCIPLYMNVKSKSWNDLSNPLILCIGELSGRELK